MGRSRVRDKKNHSVGLKSHLFTHIHHPNIHNSLVNQSTLHLLLPLSHTTTLPYHHNIHNLFAHQVTLCLLLYLHSRNSLT